MSAQEIAALLGLALPQDVTPAEGADWWRESAEIAQGMIPEEIAYRKAGGW